jgi:hypothetical protein
MLATTFALVGCQCRVVQYSGVLADVQLHTNARQTLVHLPDISCELRALPPAAQNCWWRVRSSSIKAQYSLCVHRK